MRTRVDGGLGLIICAVCDGEMTVSDEKGKPMILLTGDIEYGSERLAVCKHCGHRQVIMD